MLQPAGYRPAQAFVRAGVRTGNAEFGIRNLGTGMSVSGDCGFGGAVCLGVCPALRLWRGVLPWFAFGLCVPVAGLPSRRALGIAFLSWVCPLARAWHCGSGGAVCPRFMSSLVVLLQRFALGSCPVFAALAGRFSSVHVRHSRLWWGGLSRVMSGLAVLLRRFAIGSRLSFSSSRKKRRLAIRSVPIPPGRDRHSRVLDAPVRLSALVGSLRACTFLCGDPDG